MFMSSQKVICVDDTNPNPLCRFPCGCVVRGRVYALKGVTVTGGVQIEGLPVFHYFRSEWDVGWKPHRFRKHDNQSVSEEFDDSPDLELVGTGSGR